jgi:hypothetical protein
MFHWEVTNMPKRSLMLAGGGVKVAFQGGYVASLLGQSRTGIRPRRLELRFFLQRRLLDGSEHKGMPIEDYSVAWSETRSVPVRVARLLIPSQKVEDSFSRQEDLSFSPLNTTCDLRPLGD